MTIDNQFHRWLFRGIGVVSWFRPGSLSGLYTVSLKDEFDDNDE